MLSKKQKAELAKKGLVTTGEAAKMLDVSCQWLWKQIDKGLLPAEKFEGPGPAGYGFVYGVDFAQAEECRDLYFRNPPALLVNVSRETIPQEPAEIPLESAKETVLEKLKRRRQHFSDLVNAANEVIENETKFRNECIDNYNAVNNCIETLENLKILGG